MNKAKKTEEDGVEWCGKEMKPANLLSENKIKSGTFSLVRVNICVLDARASVGYDTRQ